MMDTDTKQQPILLDSKHISYTANVVHLKQLVNSHVTALVKQSGKICASVRYIHFVMQCDTKTVLEFETQ